MTMLIYFAALLVGAGLLAAATGAAAVRRSRRDQLRLLAEAELAAPETSPQALRELMERAGLATERVLAGTSWHARISLLATRAGWTLRPGELAAVMTATSAAAGLVAGLVSTSAVNGIVVAAVSALAWPAWLRARGRRRVAAIEAQLPTVLQVLAGSLSSGASVLQALDVVVAEGTPPLAGELARVVAETRVGRPLTESLQAMAERNGSRDLDWTAEAVRIQHATGGRLADTFRVLADFMRARQEVRGEVRALSAEARLSAKVLTALPLLLGMWLVWFRPRYVEPLFETSFGRAMVAAALAGIAIGTLWMRRIVRVEV